MIDKSKNYRTRDGREVRIYATDGVGDHAVHGAVKHSEGWDFYTWRSNGKFFSDVKSEDDLIEVRPRIKRTGWVNVYPSMQYGSAMFWSKSDADVHAHTGRLACVKVEIDCEEGTGL